MPQAHNLFEKRAASTTYQLLKIQFHNVHTTKQDLSRPHHISHLKMVCTLHKNLELACKVTIKFGGSLPVPVFAATRQQHATHEIMVLLHQFVHVHMRTA
jgi:hypothetical protein